MSDTIERHCVRVWFGTHVIAAYSGDAEHAECYARAMDRRFPGLRITDEVIPLNTNERPLSGEQGAPGPGGEDPGYT